MKNTRYNLIVCGGTFDYFHKGHEAFLEEALKVGKRLLVGITTDTYVEHIKHASPFQPYTTRHQEVTRFFKRHNALDRVEVVSIDSVYIPKKWNDQPVEAILVTEDSLQGAERLNSKRREEGRGELVVLSVPLALAEDGLPLSATRIRKGEINREGKLFIKPIWYKKTLFLPENLRPGLQKPFGELIDAKTAQFSEKDISQLVTVGDITTKFLTTRKIWPRLCVIDLVVERKKHFDDLSPFHFDESFVVLSAQNPSGQLTPSLFSLLQRVFQEDVAKNGKVVIHIDGEEDLVVLPVILFAPLGWVVLYGQPGSGTVRVVVTEKMKERAYAIVSSFTMR